MVLAEAFLKQEIFRVRPHYAREKNGGYTLKTHLVFSVHATPGKAENPTRTDHV